MAITVAVRAARRDTDGIHAALTEVAARPTPRSTSAHEPDSTMADVVRTNTAIDIPIAAMAMRAALPSGLVAHAWSTGDVVVITSGVGSTQISLEGSADPSAGPVSVAPGVGRGKGKRYPMGQAELAVL